MIVNCFTVKVFHTNRIDIKNVFNEFGNNIPNYLQYEGGSMDGCVFLFCVDINVDVEKICKKYNCDCSRLEQLTIDCNKYNSSYTIHPNYKKYGSYTLEPNIQYNIGIDK